MMSYEFSWIFVLFLFLFCSRCYFSCRMLIDLLGVFLCALLSASSCVCVCWLILDLLFSHTYITHINRFARWRCSLFAYLLLISWKIGLVVQFSVFSLSFVLVHTLCSLSWFLANSRFCVLCFDFVLALIWLSLQTSNCVLDFSINYLFFFVCGFHRKERIGKKTQNCKINKKPIFFLFLMMEKKSLEWIWFWFWFDFVFLENLLFFVCSVCWRCVSLRRKQEKCKMYWDGFARRYFAFIDVCTSMQCSEWMILLLIWLIWRIERKRWKRMMTGR